MSLFRRRRHYFSLCFLHKEGTCYTTVIVSCHKKRVSDSSIREAKIYQDIAGNGILISCSYLGKFYEEEFGGTPSELHNTTHAGGRVV